MTGPTSSMAPTGQQSTERQIAEKALERANLALARLEGLRPVLISLLSKAVPSDIADEINRAFEGALGVPPIEDDPSQAAFDDVRERNIGAAQREFEAAVALYQSAPPDQREALRQKSLLLEQKLDGLKARPRTMREAASLALKAHLDNIEKK